jgi:hypothetical protein
MVEESSGGGHAGIAAARAGMSMTGQSAAAGASTT